MSLNIIILIRHFSITNTNKNNQTKSHIIQVNTNIPLLSTVMAVKGVLWHRIFAKGSLTVGDHKDTTPFELPKQIVAL